MAHALQHKNSESHDIARLPAAFIVVCVAAFAGVVVAGKRE